LLGVEWADLYRRMKIQETVFELLNQQYELARIQEAKEVPTVNIIDPADVPEKKSFPPRLLIVALLTGLSMAAAVAWIVGSSQLEQLDAQDPRRLLALKASETASSLGRRFMQNSMVNRLRNPGQSSKSSSE
jgi:uncharacterized protein involved in exopolysaccharide biosynthesis